MKKVMMSIIAGMLIFGCSALAQVDPDPDGIGFYADLDGLQNYIVIPPGVTFEVYLLLTNISAAGGIAGWEMSLLTSDNVLYLGYEIPYPHLNIGIFPSFAVGHAMAIIPPAPVIHLMTVNLQILDTDPGELFILNAEIPEGGSLSNYLPVYANGADFEDLRNMFPSSGSIHSPVMSINGSVPVPGTRETWGSVKAMFR